MLKISNFWLYYWIGCAIGGIALGITLAIYSKDNIVVQAESLPSSPTPKAEINDLVTILFTGDVMLGRTVNKNTIRSGNPDWPFQYVKDVMQNADITYINLEGPLIKDCPQTNSGMIFCGDIKNMAGLASAGVDVVSVANNHTLNYGQSGLDETLAGLASYSISSVGAGSTPVVISRKGYKYIFLSFNDVGRYNGINQVDPATIATQITNAKELGGLVIVSFHFGNEYEAYPTNRQVDLAHLSIESGADLVIGAHPHWVQTQETYLEKQIYYSLGNFVFDQEWSNATKNGLAVRLTYRRSELVNTEELPVFIQNFGQPSWK